MTARLFLKLQLWFNWHFTWDEFTSTVGLDIHSCFLFCRRSHGGHIAQCHYCIIQREPISLSKAPTPSPINFFPPHPEGTKLTRSQTTVVLSTVKAEKKPFKISGNDWQCYTQKIHFGWMQTHTPITVIKWGEHRQNYSSKQIPIVLWVFFFFCLRDIEMLESGQ